MTILCLASYYKGSDFLRSAKQDGARVLLLTSLSLKNKAAWPMEAIDEIFYMPDVEGIWNREHVVNAVSYLAQREKIQRVVALDDFDLEMAATLREHLRVSGLGETATRFFRDKLAMRQKALDSGLRVPEFCSLFYDADVSAFLRDVPGPWMFKPRSLAGAIGIKKIEHPDDLWRAAEAVGDLRTHYLIERFVPGDVFHVDTLSAGGNVLFEVASTYGRPPMDVAHGGGVFTTRNMRRGDPVEQALYAENRRLLRAFGLLRGASHSEFIRAHEDNAIYFLETSARVGGANIADMVEAATGVNLWGEWARTELAEAHAPYRMPQQREDYAALLVSLAKDEWPDTARYDMPEIVWRMNKKNHVGLVVASPHYDRVSELLEELTGRVLHDFTATMPARDRPSISAYNQSQRTAARIAAARTSMATSCTSILLARTGRKSPFDFISRSACNCRRAIAISQWLPATFKAARVSSSARPITRRRRYSSPSFTRAMKLVPSMRTASSSASID